MNTLPKKERDLLIISLIGNCISILFLGLYLNIINIAFMIMNIISIVLCLMLIFKHQKSVLVYICLIVSAIFLIVDGYTFFKVLNLNNHMNAYEQSEEFFREGVIKSLETSFAERSEMLSENGYLNHPTENNMVVVNKQTFEKQLELYNNYLTKNSAIPSDYVSPFAEEHEDLDYDFSCDGYVILEVDKEAKNEYLKEHPESDSIPEEIENKVKGTSYLACTGKYNYQTTGYDSSLMK